jgi:hypothetical protein
MPRTHDGEPSITTPTAAVARAALLRVEAERFETHAAGVTHGPYVSRLDKAVANARRRYVLSAVTELASLRGALNGTPAG